MKSFSKFVSEAKDTKKHRIVKESKELEEAKTKYVIKHKKNKQVLNTHDDYATAKDEHEGLGAYKKDYGVYKQTKKDAALANRNTYREEVELEEAKVGDKVSYGAKIGGRIKIKSGKIIRIDQKGRIELNTSAFLDPSDKVSKKSEIEMHHDFIVEQAELDEAKTDIYHKHMLKALGKSRLPKNHSYTSAIANNGDFVVHDGGGRIAGRIPKDKHDLK